MARPVEIVWFERVIVATLVLGALNSWLAWPRLITIASPAFVISVQLFTVAIILGLTLLISRRRSNVAKWVSIALFIMGLLFGSDLLFDESLPGSRIISIIQFAAQAGAFALLFTAPSRHWFKGEAVVT